MHKFLIVAQDFSQTGGELTPTMKVIRVTADTIRLIRVICFAGIWILKKKS